MRKFFLAGVFFTFSFILLAQELQHEAIAINIEVPVRVFTKGKFVGELNLEDFEVYEEGKLQKIEALYLIKRTVIEREETELDKKMARRIYLPEVSRTFVLVFEMMDYFPGIEDTLSYFFENVILPDDSLYVVTPIKTYSFKKEFLDKTPTSVIVNQLKKKLFKDIKLAAREYKSMIRDLEWLANLEDPSGSKARAGATIIQKIRNYRFFDEQKLMEFRDHLKDIEGQKYVFLFYQNCVIPIPPGFGTDLEDKRIYFGVERIKRSFADSLININFIFLTKKGQHQTDTYRMNPSGLVLDDISTEIFGAFHEMADATGGTIDSSANIASSFQRAAIASENYYLLYYTPRDYKSDGKFKKIEVKITGKNYRITHRAGYIAD